MKKLLTLIIILCSLEALGQITNASYTNKGATVPFINSSSYKLDGVTLDSANTVKRGFFTKYQYNYLHSIISSQWTLTDNKLNYTIPNDFEGDSAFTIYDIPSGQNILKINTKSQTLIFFDGEGGDYNLGVNTRTPDYSLDVNGIIKSSSYIIQQGIFAEIYCENASTAQSIPNGTTYTKLTHWTTNGESQNCTADAANDKITITKAGYYEINANSSSWAGTSGVEFRFAIFAGGVEVGKIHSWSKFANANDKRQGSIHGYYHATSVPVDIDVRARHGESNAVNLTVVYSNMTVKYIGE